MRYYYRDFVTKKRRYTRGRFVGWTKEMGPLGVPYAHFQGEATALFIPVYLLAQETRALLPPPPTQEEQAI